MEVKPTLKAFTLVELLIVLILTGLLMALSGGVFYFISTYQKQIESRAVPLNDMQRLDYLIRNDLDRASDCKIKEEKLLCISGVDTIRYEWSEQYFLRVQNAVIDTFYIQATVSGIKLYSQSVKSFEIGFKDIPGNEIKHYYQRPESSEMYFKETKNQ